MCNVVEIGKNIFTKSKKTFEESDVSDTVYAIALLEEAKRKIVDKHQEQIAKVFFQNQEN